MNHDLLAGPLSGEAIARVLAGGRLLLSSAGQVPPAADGQADSAAEVSPTVRRAAPGNSARV